MHLQTSNVEVNKNDNEKNLFKMTSNSTDTAANEITVDIDKKNLPGSLLVNYSNEPKSKVVQAVIQDKEINNDAPICRICHCGENEVNFTSEFGFYEIEKNVNTTATTAAAAATPPATVITLNCDNSKTGNEHLRKTSNLDTRLITPCFCSGSLRYVHHFCLQQWIRSSNNKTCELCKYHFKMSIRYKPFYKWERLDMTRSERKKLFFNLLFNLISMICVFWSIYVLIERATLEARYGLLDWPFWTKMLVVSIGFLGGTVFLFVQLRLYFSIFLRWRQFNRIIVIHASSVENVISSTSENKSSERLK